MNRFARTLRARGKGELMMALMRIVTVVGVMIALASQTSPARKTRMT
jgi:hypothetical protein